MHAALLTDRHIVRPTDAPQATLRMHACMPVAGQAHLGASGRIIRP
jgi:hypothetical protein